MFSKTFVKKLFFSIARIIGLFFLLGIPLIYFFQDRLIFQPDNSDISNCAHANELEAMYREKKIDSIKVRYLEFQRNFDKNIILFHGNAGSVCHRLLLAKKLLSYNYNVYLFEYPGYGGDDLSPSESLIYRSATVFIKSINSKPYIIFGESLGTGVATYIASKYPENIEAILLQSPYTSIVDIGRIKYPMFPLELLIKHEFKVDDIAKSIKAPVSIFVGEYDSLIPSVLSEKQSKNFQSLKELITYPKTGHNEIQRKAKFWEDLERILK